MSLESDHQLGVGSVLGAVAGNALGHPGAAGGNRAVAQVLGALGGGYGSEGLKDEYPARRPGEHLTVALNNGVAIGVTQLEAGDLHAGDCVRIDGSGETARVVRAACIGLAAKAGRPRRAPGPRPTLCATSSASASASGWRAANPRRQRLHRPSRASPERPGSATAASCAPTR